MGDEASSAVVRSPKKVVYRRVFGVIARHAVLLAAVLLVLLPGYFLIVTCFKTQMDYVFNKFGFPNPVSLGNFAVALRGGRFFLWFANSIILSVGAVLLSATVSLLAAFAFSRMRFRGRDPLLSIVTSLMIIPPVVMLVPLFLMLSRVGLISTHGGTILVYAGLVTPFSVYLLTSFFWTVPHEIVESALIDGASHLQILLRIMVPLAVPALITVIIVNTLWVWNDLLIAMVLLPRDASRTLMVGVTIFGTRYNKDVPVSMAGMLMASIPMLLLYLFGQRYFIRGLIAGAVKE